MSLVKRAFNIVEVSAKFNFVEILLDNERVSFAIRLLSIALVSDAPIFKFILLDNARVSFPIRLLSIYAVSDKFNLVFNWDAKLLFLTYG